MSGTKREGRLDWSAHCSPTPSPVYRSLPCGKSTSVLSHPFLEAGVLLPPDLLGPVQLDCKSKESPSKDSNHEIALYRRIIFSHFVNSKEDILWYTKLEMVLFSSFTILMIFRCTVK